jgi:hypothetical protein
MKKKRNMEQATMSGSKPGRIKKSEMRQQKMMFTRVTRG